jgi:hypothetical protein
MATKTDSRAPADGEYEQAVPDWVYQVPGLVLMIGGFGGIAFLTLV